MKALIRTLLFLFVITPLYFAQSYEENPARKNSTVYDLYQNQGIANLEYWELIFTFDVSTVSGGSENYGAGFDGTYFYTTRWASNLMHKYDFNGNLIEEFSIPGVWGIRDLTFDGTYMYGGIRTNTIYKMDFNTKTLVGTIPSPVAVGFIAYDQSQDAFWCGNWYDGPVLVNRSGNVLALFNTGLQNMSGAACEGSSLYIFDQGQGSGFPQIIYEFDTFTGLPTGENINVTEDLPGTNGISGGLFSTEIMPIGPSQIGGIMQGSPDMFFYYTNHWYIPPYSENFDSFIPWEQTACQNSLYWSTWNLTPCDSIMDPYISQVQSWSPPNSVVVIENNDLVQLHQPLTYGVWNINFQFYIPSGKTGQFGLMTQFLWSDKIYGMECYLNQGGTGRLFIDDTVDFTWTENNWQLVNILIDLEEDEAVMNLGNNTTASWQWSRGGAIPIKLDASYFRGIENSEMYIDDYHFGDYIPVELIAFRADVLDGCVILNWQTVTETNNCGFEIERGQNSCNNGQTDWRKIGFVPGYGTTTDPHTYTFTDNDVNPGNYHYKLKQIDYDGSFEYSHEIELEVTVPLIFSLEQNYPNPFNPSTTINFMLPADSKVSLKVFDVLGQEVTSLLNGNLVAGFHQVNFNASALNTGVYIYRFEATGIDGSNFISVKKMILAK